MTGEELRTKTLCRFLKLPDGLLLRITINLGDLFMPREIQNIGTHCLTYWLEGNKTWAKNSALLVVVISRKNF